MKGELMEPLSSLSFAAKKQPHATSTSTGVMRLAVSTTKSNPLFGSLLLTSRAVPVYHVLVLFFIGYGLFLTMGVFVGYAQRY